MDLQTPLQYIKGVGPRKAALFERLGVRTLEDACFFLPRRYEDRRHLKSIAQLEPGSPATVVGEVQMAGVITTSRLRKKIFQVVVSDGGGIVSAKWFKFQPQYMKQAFRKGRKVVLSGLLQQNGYSPWGKEMQHPEYEFLSGGADDLIHCGRIVPVYPATEGLSQRVIRRIIKQVIDEHARRLPEVIPLFLREKYQLPPLSEAVLQVHFPQPPYADPEQLRQYAAPQQKRLIFEELFLLQLGLALRRRRLGGRNRGIAFDTGDELLARLYDLLPFALTAAQRRVLEQIKADMRRPRPMRRLLQGDVGSGKTVIALASILLAVQNGCQAAIMAPTEILAEQHYLKIHRLLEQMKISSGFLSASVSSRRKKEILAQIAAGRLQVAIGTHSLLQREVSFSRLGLVVVDEQHKFGVVQRLGLQQKGGGRQPHVLFMSATPIPRSLALTLYGDLSLSLLDESPPGRRPVRTHLRDDSARAKIYDFLRREVKNGGQVYIVYPLVEESEKLQLRAASQMYEHLRRDIFPDLRLALLHGRLTGEEKERVMAQFAAGGIDVLVATTVIEVGIDVPNASIMLIEHPERFGLSQLHQLRGRVGRGKRPSHCILLTPPRLSQEARQRLQVLADSDDGFAVAEADLRMRGPGDFWGTRQAGMPELRVANILRDAALLEAARREAFALVEDMVSSNESAYGALLAAVERKWGDKLALAAAG